MADENGRRGQGFHPRHASPYPTTPAASTGGEVTRANQAPLETAPVPATTAGFCPACGTPLEAGSRFCPRCGQPTPFFQAAQAPVPAASIPPPAPPPLPAGPYAAGPPGGHAPPGSPAQVDPPPKRRVPTWVWAAIGGFVVAAAAVAIVLSLVVFGGGNGTRTAPTPVPTGYLTTIQKPVALLTRSATVTGNALGSAAAAKDVAHVHTVAQQQLAAVSGSFATLSGLAVAVADRPSQQALLRAVGEQRRYLTLLVRTTGLAPAAALAQVGGVQAAGGRTVDAYRALLHLQPQAGVGVITAVGLTQIDGLRAALKALQASSNPLVPDATPPPPTPPLDGLGGPDGFTSPAGTTSCSAFEGTVTCSSAAGSASVDQFGTAYSSGSAGGGSPTLGYGRTWTDGSVSCSINADLGTTCTNGDGYGFQIRNQDVLFIP